MTPQQADRIIALLERLVAAQEHAPPPGDLAAQPAPIDKHREPPPEAYEIVGAKLRRYKQAGR